MRLFPAMQLGGRPPELYRQMVQGITDATFTLPGYTSADFPMMALTELPGTANSADDGTRKLWAQLRQVPGARIQGHQGADAVEFGHARA